MSGKYKVVRQNMDRTYDLFDDFNSALEDAKKRVNRMSWDDSDDTYVVQFIAKIETPKVDNAIVTTL